MNSVCFARRWHVAVVAVAALLGAALGGSPVAAASAAPQRPTIDNYSTCVQSAWRANKAAAHRATAGEARQCAPGVPVVATADLARGIDPRTDHLIILRSDGTAVYEVVQQPKAPAANAPGPKMADGCYQSWAYPSTFGTSGLATVSISAAGYGDHCGYADVPSDPTVSPQCYVPNCSVGSLQTGHYDSNWAQANLGQNSAAGWGNVSFNFIQDSWACRAWVDTNGQQNPGAWCY